MAERADRVNPILLRGGFVQQSGDKYVNDQDIFPWRHG
jgi:hypothetical protein